MTSREFAEWLAYYDLEPFGERRADLRMGRTCATIAKTFGGGNPKPSDFMPDFDGELAPSATDAELKAKLGAILRPMKERMEKGKGHGKSRPNHR